jgi:protein-tyrosine kinase
VTRDASPVQAAVQSSGSLVAEEFRLLASRVRNLDRESVFRVVGVVSAVPTEGKTTVALGLATALGRATGEPALLLEADLRRPSLERYLGLPPREGVAEWLADEARLPHIRTLAGAPVGLVAGGRVALEHRESLTSERLNALVGRLRQGFGFVVVDCPPLTPVADAVALEDAVDGMLMVVRAGRAPRESLARAAARLKPGRIRGLVFVDEPEVLPKDDSYGYRSYQDRE